MRRHPTNAFTILELMIVLAIITITAAWAVPSFRQVRSDSQLRSVAREASNILQFARNNAIVQETAHVVYFNTGGVVDVCGNVLQDVGGNTGPMAVIADANNNCCFDAGETIVVVRATAGVNWGMSFAAVPVPDDAGGGAFLTGSSFTDQLGGAASWVAFRPDGIPVGFRPACVLGETGTGPGGVYVTNAPPFSNRDYAVVLSPLGGSKIYSFDRALGAWTD